jgi:flagellar protein FlbT
MHIHLKRGEKLYVNGAVLRLDRRATLELMNDAQFLMEGHIMQADRATTPLRQLYFVTQTMLMDPVNADMTAALYKHQAAQLRRACHSPSVLAILERADRFVMQMRYFDALKVLRSGFPAEDDILGGKTKLQVEAA